METVCRLGVQVGDLCRLGARLQLRLQLRLQQGFIRLKALAAACLISDVADFDLRVAAGNALPIPDAPPLSISTPAERAQRTEKKEARSPRAEELEGQSLIDRLTNNQD